MSKTSYISLQGRRSSNEDEEYIFSNIDGENEELNAIDIIAVFDGHGGKLVSKFAKDNLYKFFVKKDPKLFIDTDYTTKHIYKVFSNFNSFLETKHPRASNTAGSTCCMIVITKDSKGSILWAINVGDSRAVLCNRKGKSVQLTTDHKPNIPSERKRIEAIPGGREKIYSDSGIWRVGSLSLSRALGDLDEHPYVSSLPQVYRYRIHPNDKFVIVGCDGVWDTMSSSKAVAFVNKSKATNPAKELAEEAIKQGSTDNVTVIVHEL